MMTNDETPTAKVAAGYRDGHAFLLDVVEVECGRFMAKALVPQVRLAIRAGRDDGLTISISSAFRTWDEQEALHNAFKQGLPGANPADPPGYSKHQEGCALDLHFASGAEREHFAAIALAHGFGRPITREPWHFLVSPLKEKEGVS